MLLVTELLADFKEKPSSNEVADSCAKKCRQATCPSICRESHHACAKRKNHRQCANECAVEKEVPAFAFASSQWIKCEKLKDAANNTKYKSGNAKNHNGAD